MHLLRNQNREKDRRTLLLLHNETLAFSNLKCFPTNSTSGCVHRPPGATKITILLHFLAKAICRVSCIEYKKWLAERPKAEPKTANTLIESSVRFWPTAIAHCISDIHAPQLGQERGYSATVGTSLRGDEVEQLGSRFANRKSCLRSSGASSRQAFV